MQSPQRTPSYRHRGLGAYKPPTGFQRAAPLAGSRVWNTLCRATTRPPSCASEAQPARSRWWKRSDVAGGRKRNGAPRRRESRPDPKTSLRPFVLQTLRLPLPSPYRTPATRPINNARLHTKAAPRLTAALTNQAHTTASPLPHLPRDRFHYSPLPRRNLPITAFLSHRFLHHASPARFRCLPARSDSTTHLPHLALYSTPLPRLSLRRWHRRRPRTRHRPSLEGNPLPTRPHTSSSRRTRTPLISLQTPVQPASNKQALQTRSKAKIRGTHAQSRNTFALKKTAEHDCTHARAMFRLRSHLEHTGWGAGAEGTPGARSFLARRRLRAAPHRAAPHVPLVGRGGVAGCADTAVCS